MTTDIKLLPLPELPVAVERFILSSLGPVKREGAVTALRTMLREYARANVAHATAAQDAEIARLTEALEFQSALKKSLLPYQDEAVASRAEIEALRVDLADYMRIANAEATRAERLADAARANDQGESARTKRYVQGVGWCWMEDGEVIEVISEAT